MAEILLTRQHDIEVTDAERNAARKVLFAHIDGVGQKESKSWRRFINMLFKLEPGEICSIKVHKARLGWYHRKHMALESAFYKSQEKFSEFDHFRNWLKVGAGFCNWYPGPKGGVIPVPKSISYSDTEQSEMEIFHGDAIAFLQTPHAKKTLWPHLKPDQRDDFVDLILAQFNELEFQ